MAKNGAQANLIMGDTWCADSSGYSCTGICNVKAISVNMDSAENPQPSPCHGDTLVSHEPVSSAGINLHLSLEPLFYPLNYEDL